MPSNLSVEPQGITFHVKPARAGSGDAALPWDLAEASADLVVTNKHRNDSIVFAVRTTAPLQFTIKNKEGLLGPQERMIVSIAARKSARRAPPQLKTRFLVQYAIFNGVHAESSDSSNGPPRITTSTHVDESLREAAMRLGKEWKGRNIDLFDSGSVVVPCTFVVGLPPQVGPAPSAEEVELDAELVALEATLLHLETQVKAQRKRNAALAELLAEARKKLVPPPGRLLERLDGNTMVQLAGLGVFVCSTALLAFTI
jgi:hypothetical protein